MHPPPTRSDAQPRSPLPGLHRLTRIAVLLGGLAILLSCIIGYSAYRISRQHVLRDISEDNLNLARLLAQTTSVYEPRSEAEALHELQRVWESTERRFRQLSLYVVRSDGILTVCTGCATQLGTYVGDARIASSRSGAPGTIAELLAARRDWVAELTNAAGIPQVVAFAYSARLDALIGVHMERRAIDVELYHLALPWIAGFGVAMSVLLLALTLLRRAYGRAEQNLLASEDRLRTIIDAEPECVKVLATDGTVLEMNAAGLAMTEADAAAQVIGRSAYDMVTEEHRAAFRALVERSARGEVDTLEFEMVGLKGTRRWMDTHMGPLRNEHHAIVGVLGVTRDITDRKRGQAILQAQAEVSAALAAVGRELISSLDTPVLLDRLCQLTAQRLECDFSHTILWQREEDVCLPVAGYGDTPEDWESIRLLRIPRAVYADVLAQLESAPVVHIEMMEHSTEQLPGLARQYRVTEALYVALRRGSEIIGMLSTGYRERLSGFTTQQRQLLWEIAQLASMALENARLVEQLERANRLKSDFVATMSHELRTPLNIIIGYNDLLLEEVFGGLQHEQTDVLTRMAKNAHQLLDLINATLDLGRLEAGTTPVEIRQIDIPEIVDDLDPEVRELCRPELEFAWDMAPRLPALHTDPMKLKLALKNVIANALKFTAAGSVRVGITPANDGVEFAVRDTGIGIGPEVLPIIFEPFRQGDGSMTRAYGGVGLGLYITQRLLGLLGGTVSVESVAGLGSTFRLWVPRHPTNGLRPQAGESRARAPAGPTPGAAR